MTLPRRVLVSCVLVLLIGSASPSAAAPLGSLSISAPSEIEAGAEATIVVAGGDGPVDIVLVDSLGATTAQTDADGALDLPERVSRVAGEVTVIARSGGSSATASMLVRPGAVVEPPQVIVGARSIVADAADTAMAVVLPTDAYGNAVADGTPVRVSRLGPVAATAVDVDIATEGLLAWTLLGSGTVAGREQVWSVVGTVTSESSSLDQVAGPPRSIALTRSRPEIALPPADGRSVVGVTTELLQDAYGNVLPDGTSVLFRWTAPDGGGSVSGRTIEGRASIEVRAPRLPGELAVTATSKGVESAALGLAFGPAVEQVPVSVDVRDGGVTLLIGPVIGGSGALISDGTTASVVLLGGSSSADPIVVPLVGGTATIDLPPIDASTIRVEVLGARAEAAVR